MSSLSRQQLESWLQTIDVKAHRVLDIGGSQNSIKSRTKSLTIKEYRILDLKQPHECKQEPDFIRDLNDYWIFDHNDKIYLYHPDVVFCLEVSEYWYDPYQAMKNIASLMKPTGILYISFHFVYPVHNPVDQDFLRYTPRGVEKLLEETGFKIVEMKPRLLNTYIANIDGMRPAKNYDKHDWAGCLVKAVKL